MPSAGLELSAPTSLRPGEYYCGCCSRHRGRVAFIGCNALALVALLGSCGLYAARAVVEARTSALWINSQLVETLSLMTNGVRAGFAFGQSIDVAAKRIGPPMSVELNRLLLDVNLGGSMEDALSAMNERIGSDDVDMLVTAILIQRSSGGNLAEILESIGETIQERERIFGEIKTLTRAAAHRLILSPGFAALGDFFDSPTSAMLPDNDSGLAHWALAHLNAWRIRYADPRYRHIGA
jgi:hypothetical protein